jgi:TRAP transporter TAXI family solute receptor
MNKKHGELYVTDTISKDVYHGMDKDNKIATVNNLLVAHENMDAKIAYNIVKAVFDHKDELVRTHKEAENIKLEGQKKAASPIPWHPGAIKYFAEKGIKLQ